MSGVFLSYSRGDKALAERIIRGLRPIGVEVWWDEDMPGVDWQDELARQIQQLAAVVVIWTPISSASKNVRDEARLGQHTEKLVNALFGVTAPPFPFDRSNGLPLDGWTGREPHSGWTRTRRRYPSFPELAERSSVELAILTSVTTVPPGSTGPKGGTP